MYNELNILDNGYPACSFSILKSMGFYWHKSPRSPQCYSRITQRPSVLNFHVSLKAVVKVHD